MDRHRDDDIRSKVRAVYEKALDAALVADDSDIAAIDVGLRAARHLVDERVIDLYRSSYDDDPRIDEEIALDSLRIDRLSLEVGSDLARRADPDDVDGDLLARLRDMRRRVAIETGVIAPGVRVRPHPSLEDGEYVLRIGGNEIARGRVDLSRWLGVGQELDLPSGDGTRVTDPIYGTPAVWIADRDREAALAQGLQLFEAEDVVTTHVAEVIKSHLGELLSREEVAELLNLARKECPMVVQELVPNMLSLGQLRQVLQHLVAEQVPIKDLSTILNTLADNAVYTKDPSALVEHVRVALGRTICSRYASDDGSLKVFLLSPDAERAIQNAIQLNETGQVLMLDPNTSQAIQQSLTDAIDHARGTILDPVVVAPPKIRRHVRALLARSFPKLVVLSHGEIPAGMQLDSLQRIEASSAAINPPVAASGGDWLLGDDDD